MKLQSIVRRTSSVRSLAAPSLLLATLLSTGCEEYYSVEEACHENLVGGGDLQPVELDAMLRLNCYRRLAGITRTTANKQVQQVADDEIRYVQQNPNFQRLLSDGGESEWLIQAFEDPGYTGNGVIDRLTDEAVGYTIYDVATTAFWEFIFVDYAEDPADLKSGAEAIDELMRNPVFRQAGLQPSFLDGAYSEGDLPQQWFIDGGYEQLVVRPEGEGGTGTGTSEAPPAPLSIPYGRVHYFVVLYQAPHFEHVDSPVLLPKAEQIDVPLYSWSENREIIENGAYVPVQVGYPVTLTIGSIDPINYEPVDQNQYQAFISGASIVDPQGNPLETEVVHPGDDPEEVWPSGIQQRTTLALFARRPFEPGTRYDVFIDLETPEGVFTIDYWFRTKNEDPGLDRTIGLPPAAPPAARRVGRTPASLQTPAKAAP